MNKDLSMKIDNPIGIYELSDSTKYFAPTRTMFVGSHKHHLTHREHIFIVHLLQCNSIMTYAEINKLIGASTLNANRLFIKNFRKKVPKNMVKNVAGIGYKLLL
ncbi:hypothetical protein A9Q76_08020 [Arcobacter sp. 31_11_sub10_T18]|nr:hypothetical protein A9Q76_08020 [Arcobacter sp. 31_11_sub10_T18]